MAQAVKRTWSTELSAFEADGWIAALGHPQACQRAQHAGRRRRSWLDHSRLVWLTDNELALMRDGPIGTGTQAPMLCFFVHAKDGNIQYSCIRGG